MSSRLMSATTRWRPAQLADVIQAVYNSLRGLEGQVVEPPAEPLKPAVPIRKSITPEYLVCLEDGKKLKMLKRHLRSTYNMTPDEYRAKWGLAAGLSDGRAEICRAALRIRQEDRSRPRHRPPFGARRRQEIARARSCRKGRPRRPFRLFVISRSAPRGRTFCCPVSYKRRRSHHGRAPARLLLGIDPTAEGFYEPHRHRKLPQFRLGRSAAVRRPAQRGGAHGARQRARLLPGKADAARA